MGFIFYLSSIPNLKTGAAIPIELVFRKSAHLTEYAVLSFLFSRIFFHKFKLDYKRVLFFSLISSFLFALSDEFHQLFVLGRSGNLFDVGFDLVGIGLGLFIFWKIFFNKKI